MLNELETFPEIETYTLIDLYSGTERLVTRKMLEGAFKPEKITDMLSGKDHAWSLLSNFSNNEPNILF